MERWWHRRQHQRRASSPLLPAPRHGAPGSQAEEEDEGGPSSSSRGSMAGRMGREAPAKGWGGSGAGSIPSIPPASLRRQRGMGCTGKMAAPQRPAALAQARHGWDSSQAPGGAAGLGVRRARQDQSSPPTPSQGPGGLLDLCQALLHLAQPRAGSHPTGWGTPTPAHRHWPVPQPQSLSQPPGSELQLVEIRAGGPAAPSKTSVTCLSFGAHQSPQGPICTSCQCHGA